MKVLITGGAGFIGSHTADALLKRGVSERDHRVGEVLQGAAFVNGEAE